MGGGQQWKNLTAVTVHHTLEGSDREGRGVEGGGGATAVFLGAGGGGAAVEEVTAVTVHHTMKQGGHGAGVVGGEGGRTAGYYMSEGQVVLGWRWIVD